MIQLPQVERSVGGEKLRSVEVEELRSLGV
jgi:hypothetical protein